MARASFSTSSNFSKGTHELARLVRHSARLGTFQRECACGAQAASALTGGSPLLDASRRSSSAAAATVASLAGLKAGGGGSTARRTSSGGGRWV